MTIAEQVQSGLDVTDIAIIEALSAGASTTDAATAAGVSAATAYRRMARANFRVALAEARAGLWKPDAEKLRAEVSKSIDRLVAIRDDESAHKSTLIRAAVAIIELALKLHETVEVESRLAAIEAALAERGSASSGSSAGDSGGGGGE